MISLFHSRHLPYKTGARVLTGPGDKPQADHWSVSTLTNTDNHTATPNSILLTCTPWWLETGVNREKTKSQTWRKPKTAKLSCCEAAILSIDPPSCHIFPLRGHAKRKTENGLFLASLCSNYRDGHEEDDECGGPEGIKHDKLSSI